MSANDWLENGLSSRNGFVRKGSATLLAVPKWVRSWRVNDGELAALPPVLANSFPKSGTHLLVQIVDGLDDRVNYGTFLASEISSFQFRERTARNTCRFIRRFVPGEIIRGHLFYDPQFARQLAERNVVHYFIYRDPRAVVVSEAHYLREMNPWHRLHRYFRRVGSIDEAIALSIDGLNPPVAGISYPNIAARFARYEGWLAEPNCMAIRYEDLLSEQQPALIRKMAEFYAERSTTSCDVEACVGKMSSSIAPQRSHTFRSGKRTGWRSEFTAEHSRRFVEVAGDLLIRLGYESNHDWASNPLATPV